MTGWGADRFTDNESTSTNTLYMGPNLRQRPIESSYDVKDYRTGKGDETREYDATSALAGALNRLFAIPPASIQEKHPLCVTTYKSVNQRFTSRQSLLTDTLNAY